MTGLLRRHHGKTLREKHPHKAVRDIHRYLRNNASRTDDARYRHQGLPITSDPMESPVKQMELRVKGTKMFWNDVVRGGETILQICSATLLGDRRLDLYLFRRPGSFFVRRSSGKACASLNS